MDKLLIPGKRLVAVTALLAMSGGTSHAQVVASYDIHPDRISGYIVWGIGGEPYELSRTGRDKLIAIAARTVSPDAPLLDLDVYISCNRYCNDYPRAKLIFGPYDGSANTFSTDTVRCEQRGILKGGWDCDPKKTWTYIRTEGNKPLVAFDNDVGLGVAKTIALEVPRMIAALEDEYPNCRPPEVKAENRSDLDAILSAYHISRYEATGYYWLDGPCWLLVHTVNGKVELDRKGEHEYLN